MPGSRLSQRLSVRIAVWVLTGWHLQAAAQAPMTLGAMIELEQQAIAHAQAKRQKAAAKPAVVAKLLSIYGVVPALYAVVQLNQQTVTFRQGQVRPIDSLARNLRLQAIKPPCVRFTHAGTHYRACLPKGKR